MKIHKYLENWDLKKLKINTGFLESEFEPQTKDQDAAWDLYIELITRVAIQPLDQDSGDEESALKSIHSLFQSTRESLKKHGRDAINTSKIALIVLNQILRPFLTKWHPIQLRGELANGDTKKQFREELSQTRNSLINYAITLSVIVGIEDIRKVESI